MTASEAVSVAVLVFESMAIDDDDSGSYQVTVPYANTVELRYFYDSASASLTVSTLDEDEKSITVACCRARNVAKELAGRE